MKLFLVAYAAFCLFMQHALTETINLSNMPPMEADKIQLDGITITGSDKVMFTQDKCLKVMGGGPGGGETGGEGGGIIVRVTFDEPVDNVEIMITPRM